MEFPVKPQVFISALRDPKDWRKPLVDKIRQAGRIPSGIEDSSGGDKENLEVIKRAIDDCDIHIIFIGSRFGSLVQSKQRSLTQLELEYALEQGKPILVFVQDEREYLEECNQLPSDDTEGQCHKSFDDFREGVVKRIGEYKHGIVCYFRKQADVDALASHFGTVLERLIDSPGRPDDSNWNDAKNHRRCELIDKEIEGKLSPAGKHELEELQRQMLAYRRKVAPLPLKEARRLHQQLLKKAAEEED